MELKYKGNIMLLPLPSKFTLEEQILFQHRMIYDDPDHRRLTTEFLGRPPTNEDLVRHWFETHAFEKVNGILAKAREARLAQVA